MLAKKYRISKDKDFKKIFRDSNKFETDHLSFRVKKQGTNMEEIKRGNNKEKPTSRFGIVVSNKIDKRATRRNGIRRRIRATIKENLTRITNGVDVVILVKKTFDRPYNYGLIRKEIVTGLRKAGVIK